jgi:hypothetical protein
VVSKDWLYLRSSAMPIKEQFADMTQSQASSSSQPNLYTGSMSESKTLTIQLSAEECDRLNPAL